MIDLHDEPGDPRSIEIEPEYVGREEEMLEAIIESLQILGGPIPSEEIDGSAQSNARLRLAKAIYQFFVAEIEVAP